MVELLGHNPRERGVRIGKPRLIDDIDSREAPRFMHQEGKSIEEASHRFNVSRDTLAGGFKRLGLNKAW